MKWSERNNQILLIFLFIFNVILRLPVTPHEIGSDSFMIHAWANSLTTNGYAEWIINPLSIFGLYPYSYPSGEIFLLSGISQSIGVEMEWTIWITATFIGVIGAYAAYVMAKEINDNFVFAYSVAFLYSTSRIFIGFTNWSVSTRGLFVAILPLFIWSLLKFHNEKEERTKYLLIATGLLVVLGTIHRMIFLVPIIIAAFVVSSVLYHYGARYKFPRVIAALIFFILLITSFLLSNLNEISNIHQIMFNLGFEYAMATGILFILIPVGLITLIFSKKIAFAQNFFLVIILAYTPLLGDLVYTRIFVLFIFALLMGFGLMGMKNILDNTRMSHVSSLFIILLLLFSAILPYFITVRSLPSLPMHTDHMNELTIDAAEFIKTNGVEIPRISNFNPTSRIDIIAGPPYYREDIGKLNSSRLKRVPFSEFVTGEHDYLYVEELQYGDNFRWYWDVDDDKTKRVLAEKSHLVIEDNYLPNDLAFHQSLHETRPKIYDNSLISIHYLPY